MRPVAARRNVTILTRCRRCVIVVKMVSLDSLPPTLTLGPAITSRIKNFKPLQSRKALDIDAIPLLHPMVLSGSSDETDPWLLCFRPMHQP